MALQEIRVMWLSLLATVFKVTVTVLGTTHILTCMLYFVGSLEREFGRGNWIDVTSIPAELPSYQYLRAFGLVLRRCTSALIS